MLLNAQKYTTYIKKFLCSSRDVTIYLAFGLKSPVPLTKRSWVLLLNDWAPAAFIKAGIPTNFFLHTLVKNELKHQYNFVRINFTWKREHRISKLWGFMSYEQSELIIESDRSRCS